MLLLNQPDGVLFVVGLLEPNADLFVRRSRQIFSDVIGPNRQLAMSTIDQHRELNPGWATERADRVHRRAHGPTGKENVINNDDRLALRAVAVVSMRWTIGSSRACPDIVAMHRDIDNAGLDLTFCRLIDNGAQFVRAISTPREGIPARITESRSGLRSMISCAMRRSARLMASRPSQDAVADC